MSPAPPAAAGLPPGRRPQGRHLGAARGPGPAPRGAPDLARRAAPQGAQVLPVRRRATARYSGPGRRAQQPRVGLAPRRLRGALRRRPGGRGPRREHAVLPVEPHRTAADRRGAARRPARRGAARPRSTARTRTGCTCGPTASSPTRTSCRRSLARTRGSRPAGRRSGATAGSASTAGSWPTCTRGWIANAILLLRYRELVDEPAATLDRVSAFLGVPTGVVTQVPRDNHRPVRRARGPGRTAGPCGSHRRGAGRVHPPPALAPAQPPADPGAAR